MIRLKAKADNQLLRQRIHAGSALRVVYILITASIKKETREAPLFQNALVGIRGITLICFW